MAYEVTVEVDKVKSIIKLDDTYPAVNDWLSATNFAMHDHPDAIVDFMDCAEYEHQEYTQWGYIHEAPLTLQ